jgi:phospholipid/cholesterol/gamma-HCH transport system substrate-binding protein
MATSGYDGLSHYFRAVVTFMPSTLANTGLGMLPPVGKENPVNPVPKNPNGPDVSHGAPLPFLPTLPNPDGPDNSSYSRPADSSTDGRDPESASGLNPKQEADMFDQLLGGGK